VGGVAAGDHGCDPALTDEPAVLVVVVAAVGVHLLGSFPRPPGPALYRGDAVEQRDQLGDVVAVAARDRERERDPGGVDEEVVFRPGSAPVNRARARFGAPFFACT